MAKYFVEDTSLSAIADAIREKTGTTAAMTLDEMPIAISGITSGGGDTGWVVCEETEPTKATTIEQLQGLRLSLPNATSIGDSAFWKCTSLTSVNLPVATSIGDSAFYICTSLTSVSLPSATTVGISAFDRCTSLTVADLPSATTVGSSAFEGCTSLTSVNLPVATEIAFATFANCTSLTSVNLPVAISLGYNAFHTCTSLTSVNLPAVTSIHQTAFYDCTSLTSVDLPSATSIGEQAFLGCGNLSALILRNADAVCQLIVTAVMGTKIVTAEGAPTGEGFIYVHAKFYEDYVTLIAQQAAMLLMSQGMGEAEAQATADYIARAVLRKIEDYPEICGAT